jgi:imidazolonepropionase-like amidohydrolase
MASDVGTDGGVDNLTDGIGRLSQISNRTSLMTIDAVLQALPRDGKGYAAAAAELRTVARRVVHSTRDCGASLSEAR